MAKPAHQWQTRQHLALRRPERPFEEDPRSEAFTLEFADGRVGWARCGLAQQQVDERGAADPDLVHAVSCWLIARGARTIELVADSGQVLARGPIAPATLEPPPKASAPQRLISICPSNLEAISALGCFERVLACEDSSDYPPEAAQLERLGPDLGPDLDRVAALEPELVVSSLSVPGMERNVTGLRARGVPQLVLAPRSIAEVLAELELLGRVLGVERRAAQVVGDMREQIAALERDAASLGAPARVYLEWWPRPMFSPGSACYSNELIALAGGVNVFGDRPGSSLEIDADELVGADPEVCFVSWCGVAADKLDVDRLIERPGLEALRAARRGQVYALDERFSGRPGPRMLEAARIMAAGIRAARSAAPR
ncbi:Vitamin B12-binding protein precursor [Enhygromyxa salina]|uniref:Vitamin B12-binding protein n=1 Tax=Enhygromyxa salina TaxID=215803 RepID=A0A2S9YGK8_9BACT|nr:cobalamin-binding protein [Enhygromyxa salina]PRQ04182.1 Vitamin B12-binding protein precursor [Enhygromyxa salina]